MEYTLEDDADESVEDGVQNGLEVPSVDGPVQSGDTDTQENTEEPETGGESDESEQESKVSPPDLSEVAETAQEAVSTDGDDGDGEESGSGVLMLVIAGVIGAFLMLRDDADDALEDIFQGGNNGPPGV